MLATPAAAATAAAAAAALEIGKKRPREPSTADTDLLLVPFALALHDTLFHSHVITQVYIFCIVHIFIFLKESRGKVLILFYKKKTVDIEWDSHLIDLRKPTRLQILNELNKKPQQKYSEKI